MMDELIWWLVKARVLLCWVPGILGGLVWVIVTVVREWRRRSDIEKAAPRLAVTVGIDHYPGCWRQHDECAEELIERAKKLLSYTVRDDEASNLWLRDFGEDD